MIVNIKKHQEWLKRRNLSPKTMLIYDWCLREYGARRINTTEIANFFKEKLVKYQPNSLHCFFQALISYAKFQKITIEWELITRLIPTVQQKFFATVNEIELEQLKQIRTKTKSIINQRNNLILDFLFYTGVRISELINIHHCDYQDRSLRIKGKGNKIRYIPIPNFLKKYFNGSSDYVFKTWKGQGITKKGVWNMIFRKVKQTNFDKNITPHTFRRSFATILNNKGVQLTTIQKLLGHSDINTTSNYIHNDFETLFADYSKLWSSPPPPPPLLFQLPTSLKNKN